MHRAMFAVCISYIVTLFYLDCDDKIKEQIPATGDHYLNCSAAGSLQKNQNDS